MVAGSAILILDVDPDASRAVFETDFFARIAGDESFDVKVVLV
jgi:hypothetical protein